MESIYWWSCNLILKRLAVFCHTETEINAHILSCNLLASERWFPCMYWTIHVLRQLIIETRVNIRYICQLFYDAVLYPLKLIHWRVWCGFFQCVSCNRLSLIKRLDIVMQKRVYFDNTSKPDDAIYASQVQLIDCCLFGSVSWALMKLKIRYYHFR